MTPEEKDNLLESFNFETVKSGTRYFDRDMEIEYYIPAPNLEQLIKWLMDYSYTRGLVSGRSAVQDHIKTALDL